MRLRRILSGRIEHDGDGLSVRAAIDAVVAVNVNEPVAPPASDNEEDTHTEEVCDD